MGAGCEARGSRPVLREAGGEIPSAYSPDGAGANQGHDRVAAKVNSVDPEAWPTDILARIAAHPTHRLDKLLPWNLTPASAVLRSSGMTTHVNKVHHVTTIPQVLRSQRTLVKTKTGCATLPLKWRSMTA